MKLLLITIVLLGLGIAGISQNPMLNKEGEACGFCGKTPDQFSDCNEPQHS